MVVENIKDEAVIIDLNNGRSGGVIQTVPVPLTNLSKNSFDAEKVINIVTALQNCLSKEIYSIRHIRTTYLSVE